MKHVLTIAGSDSGGCAGIQADLKTMCALGVFGMSAITALTAQNTRLVAAVQAVPTAFVSAQIEAVFSDIAVDAVKVGMVAGAETARAIREDLARFQARNIVVDPVMVSKTGCRLLGDDALQETIELGKVAAVITPNLPEAELLSGMKVTTPSQMREAALRIQDRGMANVLIKGGRLDGDADDFLLTGSDEIWFDCKRIATRNTNGTGCTLSSAIACGLAEGLALADAVDAAKRYITQAIVDAMSIGGGAGPVGHLRQLYRLAGRHGRECTAASGRLRNE